MTIDGSDVCVCWNHAVYILNSFIFLPNHRGPSGVLCVRRKEEISRLVGNCFCFVTSPCVSGTVSFLGRRPWDVANRFRQRKVAIRFVGVFSRGWAAARPPKVGKILSSHRCLFVCPSVWYGNCNLLHLPTWGCRYRSVTSATETHTHRVDDEHEQISMFGRKTENYAVPVETFY